MGAKTIAFCCAPEQYYARLRGLKRRRHSVFRQRLLLLGLVLIPLLSASLPSPNPDLVIGNYVLESSRRINRTQSGETYRASVTNLGVPVSNVTAQIIDKQKGANVPDDDQADGGELATLFFGDVLAGQTVPSSNTFTIRHHVRFPFDPSSL